jgi:hypothetical protein
VSSSGPFVAGELDPAEIEICRDAGGNKVVLGEGAFGRVSRFRFSCAAWARCEAADDGAVQLCSCL